MYKLKVTSEKEGSVPRCPTALKSVGALSLRQSLTACLAPFFTLAQFFPVYCPLSDGLFVAENLLLLAFLVFTFFFFFLYDVWAMWQSFAISTFIFVSCVFIK